MTHTKVRNWQLRGEKTSAGEREKSLPCNCLWSPTYNIYVNAIHYTYKLCKTSSIPITVIGGLKPFTVTMYPNTDYKNNTPVKAIPNVFL